jgi:hypothetical protein
MHEVRQEPTLRPALRQRLAELIPCGLFAMFILAALGLIPATHDRSVGLMAGYLFVFVTSLVTLVGWMFRTERRIQSHEWLGFEQDFWAYVDADRLHSD